MTREKELDYRWQVIAGFTDALAPTDDHFFWREECRLWYAWIRARK